MGEVTRINGENNASEGLTCIPQRIHCATTRDTTEEEYSETDMIIVQNFLHTLAEVALAVASRRGKERDEQD